MTFSAPGTAAIQGIGVAGDNCQSIQSEQHRTQQQHETKSSSGCLHNNLPRGRTVSLRPPLITDCVVVGIGSQGQCQIARASKNNDLPCITRPKVKNRPIRARRTLLPGDISVRKKTRNSLIYILNTMSLQSDAGAILPSRQIISTMHRFRSDLEHSASILIKLARSVWVCLRKAELIVPVWISHMNSA